MFSILILVSAIEYGVTKHCRDPEILVLNQPIVNIEYPVSSNLVFEVTNPIFILPLPSACSVTNTVTEIEFDISEAGEVINYNILSAMPNHTHSRGVKKALRKLPVFKYAWGSTKNRVKVMYAMFKDKT